MPGELSRTIVLVEGASDKRALEVLARRRAVDLARGGITVVEMGGATNIAAYLRQLHATGEDVVGVCDETEEPDFKRALEGAGYGSDLSRADMEALGFYVCVPDLEGELVAALGVERVVEVIGAQGELGSFRTLQRQPAQRDRPIEAHLRRFFAGRAGNKLRYAGLLVEALDLDRVPRPLDMLLNDLVSRLVSG